MVFIRRLVLRWMAWKVTAKGLALGEGVVHSLVHALRHRRVVERR